MVKKPYKADQRTDGKDMEDIATLEARDMSGSIKTTWDMKYRRFFKIAKDDFIIVKVLKVIDQKGEVKYQSK